jgi:hypothetical protein
VSVHVAFDIYPAATPNGSLLVRLLASGTGTKQAVKLTARKVLHGSGEGVIEIHSSHAAATAANFTKRNYVKVVLVNGATETEWFGFFMEQGDFGAISRKEAGGRMLTFSGPGSLYYLHRALLLAEIYAPGQPRRGNLELNGMWGWNDIPYGAIMTRAMEEGYYAPGNPLFYATWDFSRTEDSASVAWPNIDNEFTVPWGTSVYDLIASFIKLGLTVTVDPDLQFHAWQTYGTDRTSATFAAGKLRFEHGVNIGNEVTRQIRASLERSRIFVVGDEFTSVVVSGGSSAVEYYDTLQKQETNDPTTLTAAGQRDLDQREIQADAAFPVRVVIDDDELNGLYVPGEHYDVGDIATIHTVPPSGASGEHDFTNFAIEVAAIKVEHDDAGNWFAVNELGAQYLSAQLSALEVPSSKIIHQIELCRPIVAAAASCALPDSQMTQIATPNGDLETGTGANWFGNPTPTAGGPPGSSWHLGDIGVGAGGWVYEGLHALTFTAGQTYVARIWAKDGHQFQFGHIASADYAEDNSGADPAGEYLCLEWTPSANRTGVDVIYRRTSSGTVAMDEVTVFTGGLSDGDGLVDLIGTSIRAKRCDDTEHYHTTADPTVNDDTAAGFRNNTLWINETSGAMFLLLDNTEGAADWLAVGGAGVDLTGVDFLVGTATGLLSGEIVVGTTPGGELGNTWASPTIDTTHAGSNHLQPVRKNSAGSVFTRRQLNFIEGSNVTLTVADDAGNDEVDITIAAGGGGSGVDVEEDGASEGTGITTLNFTTGLDVSVTGAEATISATGGGGGTTWLDSVPSGNAPGGADDDEFDDASIAGAWTQVTASGTVTWDEDNDSLSALFDDQAAGDLAVLVKSMGALGSPTSITTAIRTFGLNTQWTFGGLVFTDGTATTSKAVILLAPTVDANIRLYAGTIDNINTILYDVGVSRQVPWLIPRLTWVSANTWRGEWSVDGNLFSAFGQADGSFTMTPTHFGVVVSTYGATTPRLASFEYFRVT